MLCQYPSNFSSLAFDSLDFHRVVGRRLVTHPCDDGSFGSLLHWNPFGTCNCPAANWRGMFCYSMGKFMRQFRVIGMEIEKRHDSLEEVVDIRGLSCFPAPQVSSLFPGVGVRGSFGFEIQANAGNGLGWCEDAFGKRLPAFLFLHDPVLASGFDSSSQCSIAGRK